jgi:hypothetical protein
MSLREEIRNILKENPEIIAEVLKLRPDILYDAIIKLTPWEKLVTKEDLKLLIELINKRFEDVIRRFEDMNNRFMDMYKRFETIDKRFEDINKRFDDIRYYLDKRIGFLEKLIIGFNIPILVGMIIALIKLFI